VCKRSELYIVIKGTVFWLGYDPCRMAGKSRKAKLKIEEPTQV